MKLVAYLLGASLGLGVACLTQAHISASMTSESLEPQMMYDFRSLASVDNWYEMSDTVRLPGMSKGAFVLQKTKVFQRAVMFSLINPQPNGAGFVGFSVDEGWNLSRYSSLELKVRGQGENFYYKVNFKHHGQSNGTVSYEQFYQIPKNEWTTVTLPFSDFKPYYRGEEVPDASPLDTADITTITLQMFGGVYSDFKQRGASSLEIDYIQALP